MDVLQALLYHWQYATMTNDSKTDKAKL